MSGHVGRLCWLFVLGVALAQSGCKPKAARAEERPNAGNRQPALPGTLAELRSIKGTVLVTPTQAKKPRSPYPKERLADGAHVSVADGGLAWLRRDGGATWLVSGPAQVRINGARTQLDAGRAFVDSELGDAVIVTTPQGQVELSEARASIQVAKESTTVYVLRGSARVSDHQRAISGEQLTLSSDGKVSQTPVVAWEDWTGGLGTADPAAAPAPFGIGTVGARKPGAQGKPRFSLVIQRLEVKVTIDQDFAVTEVDQTFVNPSSETVEGLFSFRTPERAVLQRFGVDRKGELVWGRVKESAQAVQQYESNVYAGSEEDPALLQWAGAGVYKARLYPIHQGAKRRVVTRYSEWLSRQGPRGERRLYVYPMAAEGAKGSLPRIEELNVTIDLSKASAKRVLSGMRGIRDGEKIVVKAYDFVPRADLAIELFDDGKEHGVAYRAPHGLLPEDAPENANKDFAAQVSKEEADYVAIPLRAPAAPDAQTQGVDLALVVDASAATEPSALAISRSIASSLLTHLGPNDRAALWTGDAALHAVTPGSAQLQTVDEPKRKAWLSGLAAVERGGATDLGAILTEAAAQLDPKRRGTVIYIGDGAPSVGELAPEPLRKRLSRLPKGARILAAAVGSQPNLGLLESLVRGAPVEQIYDAYGAARSSLRLLQAAGRALWLGSSLDLGPGVERILPRQLPPISAQETLVVVGRVSGKLPKTLKLSGSGGTFEQKLKAASLEDHGDLRRRWGQQRLLELMNQGAGRASLVDLSRRFGLISPVTSLYVPTTREIQKEQEPDPEESYRARHERQKRWKPWSGRFDLFSGGAAETVSLARMPAKHEMVAATAAADNKEGGTGTRAKGEEGAMGEDGAMGKSAPVNHKRYAVKGPADTPRLSPAEAEEFGMIGMLNSQRSENAEVKAPKPTSPPPRPDAEEDAVPIMAEKKAAAQHRSAGANLWGDGIAAAKGGGGTGEGIGLGSIGTLGHGSGSGSGAGFGAGRGRLDGSHTTRAPRVRLGASTVNGRLPKEVIRRIVRQNFGRFRLCYEQGLARNPHLQGRVVTRFVITETGHASSISNGGSDLPDASTVSCVMRAFTSLSFPRPESGFVSVTFPIQFTPPDKPTRPQRPSTPLGAVGHVRAPCGAAADLPLAERRVLWRERLRGVNSASHALNVYYQALRNCEASDWRERAALLVQLVDQLGMISSRVQLWRSLLAVSPVAADAVYRFMLLRVRTSQDLRELHTALGLTRIDPDILKALLKKAKSPAERLARLRGASERFSDDTELALLVLEAYEDVGDRAGGRAWARKLRRRVDAGSHVRTTVGEYYLRLSKTEQGSAAQRDADEARRTFGEIVEFAPEDPLARRRLGDLLRAHGWYQEAARQYESLQALTPDDPSVPLLLAAAAQGLGKTEEAVRWAQKASASGAPDGESAIALASKALASAFLAWSRQESAKANKADEVARLRARAARLVSSSGGQGLRVILSWAHPELRAALWTNALANLMPAEDNFPLLGVAQAYVPTDKTPTIQLRLDPEDAALAARLHLKAKLTLISNEGEETETIVTQDVGFRTPEGEPLDKQSFEFDGKRLKEVTL